MESTSFVTLLIIAINVFISYRGFTNAALFNGYAFDIERILIHKEYRRLVSSGFVHANWMHLGFNMLSFYSFSNSLEYYIGPWKLIAIYLSSLIGGNLFALLVHKNNNAYRAVGASGAVCGIIFSAVALFPDIGIWFMPGWLYCIVFVVVSIYGMRSRVDNIGHEAHLGGALVGLMITVGMYPAVLEYNYWPIILVVVPTLILIYVILRHPAFLISGNFFSTKKTNYTVDDQYNAMKRAHEKEVDRILEKIQQHGTQSLTTREKDILNSFSKRR